MLLDLLERSASASHRLRLGATGERVCSFPDLWKASGETARWLSKRTAQGGAVAAVLSASIECIVAAVGAWRAGLTLASLPHPARGLDGAEYLRQLESLAKIVKAETLLIEERYLELLPEPTISVLPYERCGRDPRGGACDENGDFVQFTSGSTARPKGVRLSLSALASNVNSVTERIGTEPRDLLCSWLPLSHDMGFVGALLTPWCAGWDLVLLPTEVFLLNPSSWLDAISVHRATITVSPNFGIELARRALARNRDVDLTSLRVFVTGAERVRAETLESFAAEAAALHFDERAFAPAYGLAEAALAVTMVGPNEHWKADALDHEALGEGRRVPTRDAKTRVVCLGRPIPRTCVRVESQPSLDVGELQVKGDSLLSEYVSGDLQLTADGWLQTGDLGYLVDGELFVTGRLDDLVIVGGRNLYASDIEAVAADNESVRPGNCAVVSREDGGYTVVAEPRTENIGSDRLDKAARSIREELIRRLGAAPFDVLFVSRGSLPKTPSGKIRRRYLSQLISAGELKIEFAREFRKMHSRT